MVYAQSEYVPENETHKILWNFDIQTDQIISAKRPNVVIVEKEENLPNSELWRSGWPKGKTES